MAKQRFNLNETMLDARQGIEEARANAEKAGEESVATQEKAEEKTEESPATFTAENSCVEANNQEEENIRPEQEVSPDKESVKSESPAVERKINGIRKRIRKDEKEGRIMRNVYLDEDMLEKLEDIKKNMNKGRNKEKKDTLVFVIDLLNVAAQEFIDKYYKDIVGK